MQKILANPILNLNPKLTWQVLLRFNNDGREGKSDAGNIKAEYPDPLLSTA